MRSICRRELRWLHMLVISCGMAMIARAQQVPGRFVSSVDGLTVHDTILRVTWVADANLPAKQA